jgi:hypothetical protein
MIILTKDLQDVPDVDVAGANAVALGHAYVADQQEGAVAQVVPSGKRAVLEAGGRTLEVTTSGYTGHVGAAGTYLNAADAAGIAGATARMRLYGWVDRRRKLGSVAGVLIWLPGLVGLVVAVFGVVFLSSTTPSTAASTADTAKDIQAWVVSPPASAPGSLAARIALASRCLDGLAGRSIPSSVQLQGVQCTPVQPSWFNDKNNAAIITTIGGAITATLGLIAALSKLTFGHSP